MGERHKKFNKTGDIALAYRPLSKLEIVNADKSRQYSSDESSQGSPSSRGSPRLLGTIMESDESDSMDGGRNYNNIKRNKKTRKFIKKRHIIHYKTKTSKN
jgi:D-alanyl-D-alanine dipeptidase